MSRLWLDLEENITTGNIICCLVNVSPNPFFWCNPRSEMAGKIDRLLDGFGIDRRLLLNLNLSTYFSPITES